MKNQYSIDILAEYQVKLQRLINTYCQVRELRPFDELTECRKAIWHTQVLVQAWQSLSDQLIDEVYEEDDNED